MDAEIATDQAYSCFYQQGEGGEVDSIIGDDLLVSR